MFTATQGKLEGCGYDVVTMTGAGHEVRVMPQNGFNLYYWTFDGGEILMKPVDINVFGTKYGVPVLFPTPNRLKNSQYTWQGVTRTMKKRGEVIPRHGLVKDEPFTVVSVEAGEDCASCTGEIEIAPDNDLFEGYPFPCKLTLTYTLKADGVHLDVMVENKGEQEMPFGFCIHPYFSKRGDASKCRITMPLTRRFVADKDGNATGEIVPATGDKKIYDDFYVVEDLYLDDVYTGMSSDRESLVRYDDIDIHIRAADCFRQVVVFTPHDRPGFCIEPQTNASDFINLHARGLIDESGLLVLPAGQTFRAWAEMTVTKR